MHNNPIPRRHRFRPRRAAVAALFLAGIVSGVAGAPPAAVAASRSPAVAFPGVEVQLARGGAPGDARIAQGREGISLSEAIRLVEQRSGGQVLRAEAREEKGRTVYRIRVITDDGRVRTWHVDAESGRVR